MKKLALVSLLALAGLSIAAEAHNQNASQVVMFSPDIPPPDCSPNCSLSR